LGKPEGTLKTGIGQGTSPGCILNKEGAYFAQFAYDQTNSSGGEIQSECSDNYKCICMKGGWNGKANTNTNEWAMTNTGIQDYASETAYNAR